MTCMVSVIVSVYNDPIEYFEKAIKSICNQTYKGWEMIIINDGDHKNRNLYKKCIDDLGDDRIIYIMNDRNQGISVCLNQALKMAKGKYIAKMDSDDISLPTRFEKQLNYFNSHPKCNVLGTYAISFGDIYDYNIDYNHYSKEMRSVLLMFRNSGLIHPTAMIRKRFLDDNNIRYDENFKKALDYRLWVECTKYSRIDCLNEVLFLYRRHPSQISTSGKNDQDKYRDKIRILQLKNLTNKTSKEFEELHLRFCSRENTKEDLDNLYLWCNQLISENKKKQIYNSFLFKGILYSESFTAICKHRNELNLIDFLKKISKYISIECCFIFLLNKIIYLCNNLKKRMFPVIQRKNLHIIEEYIK